MRPYAKLNRALVAHLVLPATLSVFATSQTSARHVLSALQAAPTQDSQVSALPVGQVLKFGLTLPLHHVAELQLLLREQQDPTSPTFHQYLSRQEFVDRFGPTAAEYEQLQNFARAEGFTVLRTFENRQLISVRATVAQVNRMFGVQMRQMKAAADNRAYYAPDVEPSTDSPVTL